MRLWSDQGHGCDSFICLITLNFMCTLWIVFSESVLLFCVVFSSSHFAWLFLCFYDTHLVASLEHSGAAQRKKSTEFFPDSLSLCFVGYVCVMCFIGIYILLCCV